MAIYSAMYSLLSILFLVFVQLFKYNDNIMVIYQNGNEYNSTFGLIEEQSKIFGVNINNYLSRNIYKIQIRNGRIEIASSPEGIIITETFSHWIKENEGKFCDFIEHNGVYTKDKMIRIGLILDKDYDPFQDVYNVWLSFEHGLTELNNDGGINNHYIISTIKIVRDELVLNNTIDLIENENVDALFGCLSIKCRNIVSEISKEKKILFFFIGETVGEWFSLYTINLGCTLNQKLQSVYDYNKQFYKNYFILVDKENEYLFCYNYKNIFSLIYRFLQIFIENI